MTASTMHDLVSDQATFTYPASVSQEGLWFLDQLELESAVHNIPLIMHLKRRLDVEILQQSLNAIVQRHEALRATFRLMVGQLVQVIAPNVTIPLFVVDLLGFRTEEREAEGLRLSAEEARRPFDLSQGPLLRVSVLHLGTDEDMLLLTIHRIICDRWSLVVLVRELTTLYEAFSKGQVSPLPKLPTNYTDFIARQRQILQGDSLTQHLAYWTRQLAGSPVGLELPTDRSRLPVATSRGSTYCVTLQKALTNALKELSRRRGVTLYMTLAAAFQTLLYRYSGQDDVAIGTFTAGRTQAETEALIGSLANMLVLRTDLSGNPTFPTLLGQVRERVLEAEAYQELPFEYLVKELQPKRQPGQNPLFQVMLTIVPSLPTPPGWAVTQMTSALGTSRFDLTLELEDDAEGLLSRFEYSTDLFDEATIVRMAQHWHTLLEGVVADPTRRLVELPLLTEKERHQLLIEWNATQIAHPKETCAHQLFEAQVERTPEAIAVVFEEESLTYRELNRKANQLAHHLRHLGVGPDVMAGVCIERSLDMVVGLLGIFKAGGAYLPLDPGFPFERLTFMLEDAAVPVLLTQQHLSTQFPKNHAKIVCIDSDGSVLAQQSETNLPSLSTSASLAYVIYTSGSTGRPKGVQLPQRAIVNFLLSMREQPGLTAQDRLLAVTTLSFDIAVLELFLPLIVGARVIMASRQMVADGAALLETIVHTGATVMQATPVTWRILLAAGWQGSPKLKILTGGESLPLELAQQLLPNATALWNLYGPTETTVYSTACEVKTDDKLVTIGRPIANTQVYILDGQLQPVPVGVAGELYIGGDGLARGYLDRPELTAERFVPHPFSDEPGACLYKTGDLARYRVDGAIEHLGRLDFQVKLRGYRIELGEIEAVLSQQPAVRQAVVVAREHVPGDTRLVAYVVLHDGHTATIDELRSHVAKQVPAYMIPSVFMLLETLPLTPNGKIDRRALPAPEMDRNTTKASFVAPTSLVHHQLVQIWEDLLGIQPIGIKDDFFELGGHSLLAARLFDRMAQVCGKKLPLSTLFAGATIEQLAEALMEDAKTVTPNPMITVQAGGSRRPFFYLHGQWEEGFSLHCYPLARALGPDQPFYALDPYPLDGRKSLPTLEQIAAAHIKAIRAVQPEGPYLLGGWCNGGLYVYETARQLQAEGQAVDLLVLMDPAYFVYPISFRLYHAAFNRLGKLLRVGQDKRLDWYLRLKYLSRPLSIRLLRREDSRHLTLADLSQDYPRLYDWIALGYRPTNLYDGKVTFFWANEGRQAKEFRKGWRQVEANSEVEVHLIPGDHITCRTDYLHFLGAHLDDCIRKAQEPAAK
jgi:surfactin family lipopeptide synthetase A